MIQEFLRTVPLFHELDDEELTQVLLVALVKRYSSGARILEEEQSGGQLHVIREGQVRISKTVPGLGEEALTILGPGEFFGEVEFFDGSPASARLRPHRLRDPPDPPRGHAGPLEEPPPARGAVFLGLRPDPGQKAARDQPADGQPAGYFPLVLTGPSG